MPDGYQESIRKGLYAARSFSGHISCGTGTKEAQIARLKTKLDAADAVVIGAGAGLSVSAGLTYSGERFDRYFFDFAKKYGIQDMYSGGFYPFPDEETRWAWWARHIYCNRYIEPPKPVYKELLRLMQGRDFFVITTNVDHQFQRAGFDKKRLFYTQGDYGLWQCSEPCHDKTYDNEETVRKMIEAQGFAVAEDGSLTLPEDVEPEMTVPGPLVPYCPVCGKPMSMNLRADDTFVEDEGWHRASAACADFLRRHENLRVLYLELGVGANTPVIVKYPFWQMTAADKKAVYVCINYGASFCPEEIADRSICIDGDIGDVLRMIR